MARSGNGGSGRSGGRSSTSATPSYTHTEPF